MPTKQTKNSQFARPTLAELWASIQPSTSEPSDEELECLADAEDIQEDL